MVGKTYLNALGQTEKCTGFIQMPLKKDTGVIGNARLACISNEGSLPKR